MGYSGSCHCGAVRFTVDADLPSGAMSCNCSHCRRKGFLLAFVPIDQFRLTSGSDKLESYKFNKQFTLESGSDALTEYRFHKKNIRHLFCATCGCQGFGEGKGPDGKEARMVNLRCVPDCDIDALTIEKVGGASF